MVVKPSAITSKSLKLMTASVPSKVVAPRETPLVMLAFETSSPVVNPAEGVTVIPVPPPSGERVISPSAETSKSVKSMTAVVPRIVLSPTFIAFTISASDKSSASVITAPPPVV